MFQATIKEHFIFQLKERTNMSAENALADLGLDIDASATTEAPAQEAPVEETVVTDNTEEASSVTRKAVAVETSVSEDFEDLPPMERNGFGGPREKKYPFDELAAPKDLGEGRMGYASFTVRPAEGEDVERAVRSAQSAATQANKQAKEAGEVNYYVTRALIEGGEQVGLKIFRTDARPEKVAS